ncbi:MAG: DUF4178 domain-containing protein [Myxococcales bacterium]|nr:DUF4178 domain-containing protein [Myxococcales bacterium]MCB9538856.1 DUF4178 domain-containing protein [Myxococcales bacterium]
MGPLIYIAIGLGVAVAVGVVISRKKQAEAERARRRDATVTGANVTNDITRVGKGGVLRLPPFGQSRTPIETHVTRRHRYRQDAGDPWYELVCEHGRRELLVEWSRSGGEVYVTGGFEDENPSLGDLMLTEDDLIAFDEGRRTGFEWDGVQWTLAEPPGERFYHADDRGAAEGYYAWEFRAPDESRYLSIEKWEGEADFEVYHLWAIDARGVEVYDAGAAS